MKVSKVTVQKTRNGEPTRRVIRTKLVLRKGERNLLVRFLEQAGQVDSRNAESFAGKLHAALSDM